MKLRKEFITHNINDEQVMVATDTKLFSGLVKSNCTAAFIIDCLKNETSVEDIVNKLLEEYDVDRSVVERDVEKVINTLKSIGALND